MDQTEYVGHLLPVLLHDVKLVHDPRKAAQVIVGLVARLVSGHGGHRRAEAVFHQAEVVAQPARGGGLAVAQFVVGLRAVVVLHKGGLFGLARFELGVAARAAALLDHRQAAVSQVRAQVWYLVGRRNCELRRVWVAGLQTAENLLSKGISNLGLSLAPLARRV